MEERWGAHPANKKKKYSNASRDAHRHLKRLGVGWKVKQSTYVMQTEDGPMNVPYLEPRSLLQYIMEKAPEVCWGGFDNQVEGVRSLELFWRCYEKAHPEHEVFRSEHAGSLGYVVPLIVHGDEGKGLRRANVAVVSLEAAVGIHTVLNKQSRRGYGTCQSCAPQVQLGNSMFYKDRHNTLPASSQCTNMTGHSFLQHWPLWLVPATLNRDYDPLISQLMDLTVDSLRSLFFEGVRVGHTTWAFAIVGQKGDLKWLKKVGKLIRGYENKGRVRDRAMCCSCLAGSNARLAYEDFSDDPAWKATMWSSRPWSHANSPCLARLPFDQGVPEKILKIDVFHTCKVGVFRDFVGSSVMWLVQHSYFGNVGDVAAKLGVAFGSFKLFCHANHKTMSLRSFTKSFMNYKSSRSFPWSNSKGSDTMLMLQWLRTLSATQQFDLQDPTHGVMFEVMYQTACSAIRFFEVQNTHGIWLQKDCATVLQEQASGFLRGFAWLAAQTLRSEFNGWGLKPKLHYLKHVQLELLDAARANHSFILNPMLFGCEQNEDLIGRVCTLSRKVSSRLMQQRVLECFLVKAGILLKRFRQRRG